MIVFLATLALACQKRIAESPRERPGAPAAHAPAVPASSRIEVAVTDHGFVPNRIGAQAGKPITLVITRKTERTCATEILFAGTEGKTELPFGKTVAVTYTPKAAGEVKFGCAMGMMIGGVLAVSDQSNLLFEADRDAAPAR